MSYWFHKKEKNSTKNFFAVAFFHELLKSFGFGAIGGAVCGSVIWSFTSLIGNSGTTGTEYIGYWDWGVLGLGIMYGSFFGILLAPLGYVIFLRNIGLRKGTLPAAIGTILGGFYGAFTSIFEALRFGCLGFFLSLFGLWLITHVMRREERIRFKE